MDTDFIKNLEETLAHDAIKTEGETNEIDEVLQIIAYSISLHFYAIYHIWVADHTYLCFTENRDGVLAAIGQRGDYASGLAYYIDNYVVPEDRESMLEFTNLDAVKEQLRERRSISRVYRQNNIGWTRGTFIAGKRDEDGNVTDVVYAVADINDEVEQEQRQSQIVYEAEHDALTGLYNRKGFERVLSLYKSNKTHVGFIILDVDHFKSLNDNFGHIVGDQVLIAVAQQLTANFYQSDVIARLGGDEFVILLPNCDESAWSKICMRLRAVHVGLAHSFPQNTELSVTLSSGLAFSHEGYHSKLYKLADEGLYETKRLGRAGCTHVGSRHKILNHWKDETLSLLARNVLEYNNTGICQIEIPDVLGEPRRLICGDIEKSLLGIPNSATPEECYVIWRDRIDPSYMEAVHQTERSMIEYGQTECTFLWKHPEQGLIYLRCGGFGEKKPGKITLTGYLHPLTNTRIIEKHDDQADVLRALNSSYVASWYIDFEQGIVSAFKIGESVDYIPGDVREINDLLKYFIYSVVDPRDRERMREFSDVNTLQERLRENHSLNVEYRSMIVGSWCRARLLPVRFDDGGLPTHVLLTIVAIDLDKPNEVYSMDYDRRSLNALFDHLHCGIVMYEWRDGIIDLLHVSKYYEDHYSHRFVKLGEDNRYHQHNGCIHPEDLNGYQRALEQAMFGDHELHYEYRVWDDKCGCYIWEKADVVFTRQQDGSYMIYAVYTDITQRKEQELQLERSHASLLTALNASNQLCYEYDPLLHTETCLVDDNFFGLPKCIENYPDSLRDSDIIHPDDVEEFIETAHKMDNDADYAQCDARMKKDGQYIWYSCKFRGYYDPEKERKIAILSVVDITLRMATRRQYEERLKSLTTITENTLCMSLLNLTNETYELIECSDSVRPYVQTTLPFREYLVYPTSGIVGEDNKKKFRELFDVDYLIQEVEEGHTHHDIEYMLEVTENHYEWILSGIDLVRNPVTNEIAGTIYSISKQTDRMNQMLLKKTLEQDYMFVTTIVVGTDEFYLYNPHKSEFSKPMKDYWNIALKDLHGHCSEETEQELREILVKDRILEHLEHNSEFVYAYDGFVNQSTLRLEIRFSYGDDAHTILIASMRNITDTALLAKYRHDSEHDALTNLYNRWTMFRKCRELLDAHPEDKFVMLHVDIKHFRLYNTFYGDKAGDKLLCAVADIMRMLDDEYDYWAYGRIESDVFAAFFPYEPDKYHKHIDLTLTTLHNYHSDFLIEPALGMYFVTDPSMSMESMFTRATLAAKMVQPDTPYATVTFDESMEEELRNNQAILNDMQSAIDEEQFKVYLQPKYSLSTDEPVGAEALVRWMHPTKGLIPPNQFIPIFESNGFITNLDRYMWEHTCQLISKWKRDGQTLMPISVNVSRISAYSMDTVPYLKELVKKYDIDPQYLELELTESAYVESPEEIRLRLLDLQAYGFKILMDDFGSGYSSLNTLKDLPIDILKLDMKFLSDTGDQDSGNSITRDKERGIKILSSMIKMSKLLYLPVIAEGVETEDQALYLRSIGCEYVQGYLYARPMPVAEYEETIMKCLRTR